MTRTWSLRQRRPIVRPSDWRRGSRIAVLNVVGFLRYPGGPLREPSADGVLWLDLRPSDQGSSSVGNSQPSDWANVGVPLYDGLLSLHNPWPWTATVEAITLVDPPPGLTLDGVYVSRPGWTAGPGGTIAFGPDPMLPASQTLDGDFIRLPAPIEPTGDGHERDALALLVVRGQDPGAFGFAAVSVDYRIGPMTFHVVHHLALAGCLGRLPPGASCPAE